MHLRTHVSTLTGTCALGDTSAQVRTVGGCPHGKGLSQHHVTQAKKMGGKISSKKWRCS